jgi:hypothetical protein
MTTQLVIMLNTFDIGWPTIILKNKYEIVTMFNKNWFTFILTLVLV